MELSLSNEQQMIVDMVRRFVREEIVPLEMHLDPDADQLESDDRERLVGAEARVGGRQAVQRVRAGQERASRHSR